ncbi:MAG: PQQ-binding-like beta-propeller repeat protein [Halodesulfurarchaeum sp.]
MTRDWSRRALLASLGTLPLAGCGGDGAESPTPGSPTPTPTESPTATLTETQTETPTPTETPTEPQPPSTPSGTPTRPERIDSSWPMPAHDAGLSNATDAAPGPTDLIGTLWRIRHGASLSRPVVADGTVFVGAADGTVLALSARSGSERWRRSVGSPTAAPWVVGDRLYIPTDGAVVSLAISDGSQQWRKPTPDRAAVLMASHGVYWIANGEPPSVVSLTLADGSEHWRTDIGVPWIPHLFASDETVFVSTGTKSNQPWELATGTGDVKTRPQGPGADFPSERFFRDGTVYAVEPFFGSVQPSSGNIPVPGGMQAFGLSGGLDRVYLSTEAAEGSGLYALPLSSGVSGWRVQMDLAEVTRPVVAGECVLLHTGDALRCFDPGDGAERWAYPGDRIGRDIAVADDLVFASMGDSVRAYRPP